jgi:hypothetical protein
MQRARAYIQVSQWNEYSRGHLEISVVGLAARWQNENGAPNLVRLQLDHPPSILDDELLTAAPEGGRKASGQTFQEGDDVRSPPASCRP